jgi:FtsH-binding integral membrane protein
MENFNIQQFLNLPLSSQTQNHVFKVYKELATMFIYSAVGVYTDMLFNINGMLTTIGTFAALLLFSFTNELTNQSTARMLLYAFSFLKGITLGSLLKFVIMVDESIILKALGATGLIFVCFSLSVLYSRNQQAIATAGMISSVFSVLFWVQISNWFLGSTGLYNLELYLGLGLFSLYVIYDTQILVNKAERGEKTVYRHAMELYSDFVALFVRLVVVLLRKQEEKKKKRRH